MARRPNFTTTREPPGVTFTFLPHEFRRLKFNKPGPSGKLGGAGGYENKVIEKTDPVTLVCTLDPLTYTQVSTICRHYGPGGPNNRIRRACIPALRRVGIDLMPEWRAPQSPPSSGFYEEAP